MSLYPRYKHAIIDGQYVNRIVNTPEEEGDPDVWKESPAELAFPSKDAPPAAALAPAPVVDAPPADAPAPAPEPEPEGETGEEQGNSEPAPEAQPADAATPPPADEAPKTGAPAAATPTPADEAPAKKKRGRPAAQKPAADPTPAS